MVEPLASSNPLELLESGSHGQSNVLSKRLNKILETRLDTDKVSESTHRMQSSLRLYFIIIKS